MPDLLENIPDHVPKSRIVDIDIFNLPGAPESAHFAWRRLQGEHDLLWTPHYGGHWIATSGEIIESIYRAPEVFSNREVGIPPKKMLIELLPIQRDGREHKAYRSIIEPAFRPSSVARYGAKARALATELIEDLAPRGRCEFVNDFAAIMPIAIFLSMMDLPFEDRGMLHALLRTVARTPLMEDRHAAFRKVVAYLEGWNVKRRGGHADDLISNVLRAEIDGRPLTEAEIIGTEMLLLFAGLDTVTGMMSFVMRYLAEHPKQRRWIIDNPAKISFAAEELMRRHGVANNVRTASKDVVVDGLMIREGEHIVLPGCLHGLDERQFEHAQEVDFDRDLGATATFGWGPHRCIGANLARLEMRVLMEEWLKRIPDFEIDPDQPLIEQSGTVNGMVQLPLRWSLTAPA